MKINTKVFGEIEISEDKIIIFQDGIIGFPDLKRFALLHDMERGDNVGIRFLQSLEEPGFAMPVMNPLDVKPDYEPVVDDDLLAAAGKITPDNLLVLVTVSIPGDLKQMSVNLQGPFIINIDEHKGCQLILESGNYPVRFPIYDILQARKEGA